MNALRNPILDLPSAHKLETLPPEAKRALATVLRELADQANDAAETSWRKRKGPMAAYWRAVSTYAKHLARAIARPDRREGRTLADWRIPNDGFGYAGDGVLGRTGDPG